MITHLGDAALHDEEVRVVDVELDGAKQIRHSVVVSIGSVYQVPVPTSNNHLKAVRVLHKC